MGYSKRILRFGEISCDYWWGSDGTAGVAGLVATVGAPKYFVVSDERVARLHARALQAALSSHGETHLLVHPAGEQDKNLATVGLLGEQALAAGADRATAVVALGGGLTGNVAGLVAALLFRGVSLVHVPTTLLAMVDSVFSLKQAVNSTRGKNSFGTFHRPELIVADTSYLATSSPCDIRSSMCEVIKNVLVIEPAFTEQLVSLLEPDGAYSSAGLESVVDFSIWSKQKVMANDRYEKGSALVCEYGHTVGHAFELLTGTSHGVAIGVGMLVAGEIAHARGWLDAPARDLHYDLLRRNGALGSQVTDRLKDLDLDRLAATIAIDNKRGYLDLRADQAGMVLLRDLGQAATSAGGLPLVPVDQAEIRAAVAATTGALQALVVSTS